MSMRIALFGLACVASTVMADVEGWLRWRGPLQSGVSLEIGLPGAIDASEARWTFDRRGRGAPVIAEGRVLVMAYEGAGPDLQESLVCLDERDGSIIWEHAFSDFLSDVIYDRYAISSPSIDPETGNVYCMTTPGLLCGFSRDGDLLWQVACVEALGRFTYPNGRTLGPLVDGDLVIFHTMTSSWGSLGPARDRFYAYDKHTGEQVWSSTPGGPPKDSPYSYPVFEWRGGERLLYAGTAGGNVVCVNAMTGEPVWRFQMSFGGVCASPVLHGDTLIAVHGKENLDASHLGRLVALNLGAQGEKQVVLDRAAEAWRNDDLVSFSSSPVLVGNRVYTTIFKGELVANDADTGRTLWSLKLASDQIHASPAYADGRLYVPMNDGSFHVVDPDDDAPRVLSTTQLDGNCLGAPSIWNGKIYVHTTERLYCFGNDEGEWAGQAVAEIAPPVGAPASLRIVPSDVLLTQGESVTFRAFRVDAAGQVVDEVTDVEWSGDLHGATVGAMRLDAADATPGASVLKATSGGLSGETRVRVVYPRAFTEDFESIPLPMKAEDGTPWGRPPGHWIGGFPKWDVREVDGSKVLAKTIEDPLFQRTMGFLGDPSWSDYTMTMDVMSDGNRRLMSTAGMVNQRYLILLKANHRELEISSNEERIKHAVPFRMTPGTWYTLKSRVDLDESGAATVRARVWERGTPEPDEWTIEFTHAHGHRHGAPGIYGFALQSRFRSYIDNIRVEPNGGGR
ncbi:MAG: PQQ-binding-like beta-propeller repeat protein [Phycisphaerales bacterium]|nr:PQQ-binding-like beta-propeller repeat protein [Phycisphaerales bacterium]